MNITIEYMILVPVLILQIFLFPMFANVAMGQWVTDRQSIELQQTASSMGSIIEQTYLSLNHTSILSCNFTSNLAFQPTIEGYNYTATATLHAVSDADLGTSQMLTINLNLVGKSTSTTTSVTLGQNVEWVNSQFASNPPTAIIIADKCPNQTIELSFGRGA